MALTNRKKKERPTVNRMVETPRIANEIPETQPNSNIENYDQKDWTAKDRKTIKVDPDIKSLIEIFSDFDGTKEYNTIRRMAQFYLENNFDERAQRIITNLQKNKIF
ncbi:hypothetical protein HCG82_10295 [Enterococcus faecium]|uniref:hypothetical protein n=1 Tax=Enterococcus TaxID=1350 RepID=UPI001C8B28B0|nr:MULTISPECIES: hypothetical protein [Enterococcus]MBX9119738.1 hypothetical protein [Enterococcus faecium]MBX9128089.1 hypothetical protein [Enterococcus casseliflavus]